MLRYSVLLYAALMLAAGAARADTPPAAGAFLSLDAPHRLPDGKVAAPWRNAPPHFFPLAQKGKFFPLPRRARTVAAAPVPPHRETPPETPASTSASGMTKAQAHQILSLFSSAR